MANENKDIVPQQGSKAVVPVDTLNVGIVDTVSLEGLTDEQKNLIRTKQTEMLLRTQEKMTDVAIGVKAFDATLSSASAHVSKMSEDGISATISNVRNDALGKTEIMIGNTDAAKIGKMPRSMQGVSTNLLIILCFALVFVVIGAVVVLKMTGK